MPIHGDLNRYIFTFCREKIDWFDINRIQVCLQDVYLGILISVTWATAMNFVTWPSPVSNFQIDGGGGAILNTGSRCLLDIYYILYVGINRNPTFYEMPGRNYGNFVIWPKSSERYHSLHICIWRNSRAWSWCDDAIDHCCWYRECPLMISVLNIRMGFRPSSGIVSTKRSERYAETQFFFCFCWIKACRSTGTIALLWDVR